MGSQSGWVGRVLEGHRATECLRLGGILRITKPWNHRMVGWRKSWKITELQCYNLVGLGGSWKIIEQWNHRMVVLGRSWKIIELQNHGIMGLGRSWKTLKLWNGFGLYLKNHSTEELQRSCVGRDAGGPEGRITVQLGWKGHDGMAALSSLFPCPVGQNVKRESGRKVQAGNITAAKVLCSAVCVCV